MRLIVSVVALIVAVVEGHLNDAGNDWSLDYYDFTGYDNQVQLDRLDASLVTTECRDEVI
jgi:hypothetical protein